MHPSLHSNQWAAGPSTHNKTYATSLQEQDSLFHAYEHLTGVPNPNEGLTRLRKIASLVKPIMRKRGWQVQVLTEFMPDTPNLLGLNINKGYKICVRLRYSHNPGTFLPIEEIVDTMLHELSHIIWGPHDAKFHALWDELRDEHETLLFRGYTGEGFLTKGNRLGGGRVPHQSEIRRLARANAEKRRVLQKGSGRRVGGDAPNQNADIRNVIADAVDRRNRSNHQCASGTAEAGRLADQASQQTFRTKAEEDDANNRAIAEALLDLMEEDEARNMQGTFTSSPPNGGLAWNPEQGLHSAEEAKPNTPMSEEEQLKWAMEESMKTGLPQSAPLTEAQHGKRNASVSTTRPNPREPKRSKSRISTDNVLRFRDPGRLQDQSSKSGSGTSPIDLTGNSSAASSREADTWTCEICTCINPMQYLACDACTVERPRAPENTVPAVKRKPVPQPSKEEVGWCCRECASFMEHKWWTCSGCGLMKDTS